MATTIAEIFAFLVMIFVIYRYVWPTLRRMADERRELIARQVEEAEEAEKALAEARRKHDSAIAEAEREASRIRDDARADATRIRDELREQAEQEVARIKQRGEEQLAAERDASIRGVRAEVSELAMQLAQRIITETMQSEEQKGASVDGFLDDLDGLAGSADRQPAQTGGGVS